MQFLLASQDEKRVLGRGRPLPEGQALPCVEVFDGGTSQGIVAAGDLIATLASLGYKPGGAAPTQAPSTRINSSTCGRPLVAFGGE